MSREFENEKPITDAAEALILMTRNFGSNMSVEILRFHRSNDDCYIQRQWHHDFSSSPPHRYRLDRALLDRLIADRLVIGAPEWGGRSSLKFVLTEHGEREAWERRAERTERWRGEIGVYLTRLPLGSADFDTATEQLARESIRNVEWLHGRLEDLGDDPEIELVKDKLYHLFPKPAAVAAE